MYNFLGILTAIAIGAAIPTLSTAATYSYSGIASFSSANGALVSDGFVSAPTLNFSFTYDDGVPDIDPGNTEIGRYHNALIDLSYSDGAGNSSSGETGNLTLKDQATDQYAFFSDGSAGSLLTTAGSLVYYRSALILRDASGTIFSDDILSGPLPDFSQFTSLVFQIQFFGAESGVQAASYTITSLNQVPLPAGLWMMVAATGALAAARRRKRRN